MKLREKAMFSIMELRLIRHAVAKEIEQSEKKLKILDPDSDDSIEIGNDLMILRIILEKISENPDV
jgi:hypothetical protein